MNSQYKVRALYLVLGLALVVIPGNNASANVAEAGRAAVTATYRPLDQSNAHLYQSNTHLYQSNNSSGGKSVLPAGKTGTSSTATAAAMTVELKNQPTRPGRLSDGDAMYTFMQIAKTLICILALAYIARRFLRQSSANAGNIAGRQRSAPPENIDDLYTRVSGEILNADNAVREATEEMAYAVAEYGSLATDKCNLNLKTVENLLSDAWGEKYQIDMAAPGTARRPGLIHISELATQINGILSQIDRDIKQLRQSQNRIDHEIPETFERIDEARENTAYAQQVLETLKLSFPQTPLTSIESNPEQALKLLKIAEKSAHEARTDLENQRRPNANQNLTLAQRALNQAVSLLTAVTSAHDHLTNSKKYLTAAITSISSDLEDVTKLTNNSPTFTPLCEAAQKAIKQAQLAQENLADPLAALSQITDAEQALDDALAPTRKEADNYHRALSQYQAQASLTTAAIQAADNFISTRRVIVGSSARHKISEAKQLQFSSRRHMPANPLQAYSLLKQAEQSAQDAMNQANQDSLQGWNPQAPFFD